MMASNNGRTNRFVPEGGGGWAKPTPKEARRSANPDTNKAAVLRYLQELFIEVLEADIIETVAEGCGWNAESAVESLIELSEGVNVNTRNNSPSIARSSHAYQEKALEQPKRTLPYKAPKLAHIDSVSTAMAAIKVAYQGYDDDSDDADIIIEDEEEEFEVVPSKNQTLPSPTDRHSGSWQGSITPLSPNSSLTDVKRGPKECPELSKIRDYITNGNKILVLMRGCPGSGKSYLARTLITMYIGENCNPNPYIYSTDSYFSRSGRYVFAPEDLSSAHEWNQKSVTIGMQKGFSPIFVDNTNTTVWEMKPYARLAVHFGYAVQLLEPTTPWCWQETELARRNSHGVTRQSIRNMLARYEKMKSSELLRRLKLTYNPGQYPPQPCSNPVSKKTKNKSTKEAERTGQVKGQPAQLLLLSDLEKLVVKPPKRNGGSVPPVSSAPPVSENGQKKSEQSPNLFTELKPLPQASTPIFTKVEPIKPPREPIVKEEASQPRVSAGELLAEAENLHSLVGVQDSIGWQLIESLDVVLNLEPESSLKETTGPTPTESELGLIHDVDYAPSKQLLEEMEGTRDSLVAEEGLETDEERESLEKVLGDAFDHAFKLPFLDLEPEEELNLDELGVEAVNIMSPHEQVCSDKQGTEDASINTCLEYVLVGPGDSLLYQRCHDFDKQTEDVMNKVLEQVLADDCVDDLDGKSTQSPGDVKSVEGSSKRGRGRGKVALGVIHTIEKAEKPKDAELCVLDDDSKEGYQSFADDSPTEVAVDERDNTESDFQTPSGSPEPKSPKLNHLSTASGNGSYNTKPNDSSQTSDAKVVVPEKPSTKLDLFSWFFTKMKPAPDLAELQQSRKDDDVLAHANTETNSVQRETGGCGSPNQSQADSALLSADSIKWQLNNSWHHSVGDSPQSVDIVTTMGYSSGTCEDSVCDTLVQTIELLKDEVDNSLEKQLIELTVTDQTVTSNELSEENSAVEREESTLHVVGTATKISYTSTTFGETSCDTLIQITSGEDDSLEEQSTEQKAQNNNMASDEESAPTASTSEEELRILDFCTVPSSESILDSFQADFSLLDADIPHTAQEPLNDTGVLQSDSLIANATAVLDDSDMSSDRNESKSPALAAASQLEDNISGRLGSQDYQYTSVWAKMSPSNLLQDEAIPTTSQLVLDAPSKIPTKDSETNTSYTDFSLIDQECVAENVQYLSGRSRSINVGRNSETHWSVPTISTLDKGSMTAPEDLDSEQPDFELLVNMFPKIARDLLKELFEKCNGEMNWTVDLLLDSGHAFEPSESLEIRFHNTEDLQVTQQLLEELDMRDMQRSAEMELSGSVTRGFEAEEPGSHAEPDPSSNDGTSKAQPASPSKRGNKKQTSELSLRLKKEMEKNIDLSDSSYSEETLRLKKIRHGQPLNTNVRPESSPEPATQDATDFSDWSREQDQEADADEEDGTVSLTVDAELLARLQTLFGEFTVPYPEGVLPTADLPMSVARQIHGALMESQQRQFDMQEKYFEDMIKDEEYARRIQAEQMPPPDYQQILDMELAWELFRVDSIEKDASTQSRSETQDDMALRLSKQKLTELFPNVDPEMLMDVFAAHGHSFQETLEVLEASTGEPEEAVRNVFSPEAMLSYEKRLIEQAKQESIKQREAELERSSAFEKGATQTSSKEQALQQAKFYRDEASRQHQLRNECFQKCNSAKRNGRPSAASYYAHVGRLYKQNIEEANARAASSLLTANTMNTNSTTLDLHSLFVVEALQALDIFIDHHISKLVDGGGKGSRQLFLITGGGVHSVGGQPKIKPAVQRRLKQRGIRFSQLNHGCLRIIVTRHMALSNGN